MSIWGDLISPEVLGAVEDLGSVGEAELEVVTMPVLFFFPTLL